MKLGESTSGSSPGGNELPTWALAGMIFLAWVVFLGGMLRSIPAFSGALLVGLTDGIMALLVLIAAGGYGYAVFRFLAPPGTPRLLGLATAAGAGLWLLSAWGWHCCRHTAAWGASYYRADSPAGRCCGCGWRLRGASGWPE